MNWSEQQLRTLIRDLHVSEELQRIETERADFDKRNRPTIDKFQQRIKNENKFNKGEFCSQ